MDSSRTLLVFLMCAIAGIAGMHIAAIQLSLYWEFWWLDVFVHTAAGAWIALAAVWAAYRYASGIAQRYSSDRVLLFGVSSAVVIGVGWEVFEVAAGIPIKETYALDTMLDLAADAIGGFFGTIALIYWWQPVWLYGR